MPVVTVPVPAQLAQRCWPILPLPWQTGQTFSPVPGVPAGASSPGFIGAVVAGGVRSGVVVAMANLLERRRRSRSLCRFLAIGAALAIERSRAEATAAGVLAGVRRAAVTSSPGFVGSCRGTVGM
jgi:hypothetical protein